MLPCVGHADRAATTLHREVDHTAPTRRHELDNTGLQSLYPAYVGQGISDTSDVLIRRPPPPPLPDPYPSGAGAAFDV